jgi:hypothetical protein
MTSRPLIVNTGFDKAEGMEILRSGHADAIAFGSLYIAPRSGVGRLSGLRTIANPSGSRFRDHLLIDPQHDDRANHRDDDAPDVEAGDPAHPE